MTTEPLQHPDLDYSLVFNFDQCDLDAIHEYLSETAYWCLGIARDLVETSWKNSLVFGVLDGTGKQVGGCRVVTDRGTYGYLADVYVLESHQRRGLARWMMESVMSHPDLDNVRRFMLATSNMHELYRPFGFSEISRPEIMMERLGKGAFR